MVRHLHRYKFDCDNSSGHAHRISGRTGYILGVGSFHFHYFYEISSYNGHTHYYSGITGLPIKTENGHIHKIEGILELNSLHEHPFSNYTFEDISYIPSRKLKEAHII